MQSISDDTPNGYCPKCRYPLLNTAGRQKFCTNCDVKSEPSGLVNDIKDPGHNAMVKELGAMIKPEERKTLEGKAGEPVQQPKSAEIIKEAKERMTNLADTIDKSFNSSSNVFLCLQEIKDYFSSYAIKDMKEAKELMKLRKDIDLLTTKIRTFLGDK